MTATSEFQIHPLSWRADSISVDDPKLVEEQWKTRVARWARDIDDDSSEDSSLLRTPSPHELPLTLPVSLSTGMVKPKNPAPRLDDKSRNSKRSVHR
jgi:hypothetical protein